MSLNISIVIPCFNSEKYLKKCLDSVSRAISCNDEVIIVDDCSSESTKDIIKQYNFKIITFNKNHGPSYCRNAGAGLASKELIVFLDSDAQVTSSQLEKVKNYFLVNDKVQTITATSELVEAGSNFFTDYKKIYMNFTLSQGDISVNYVYGCFCATRKVGRVPWPETMRFAEDSYWGYLQFKQGLMIHRMDDIKITHLKEYSYLSLLKNDFNIASSFMKLFISTNRWSTLYSDEEFGHTSKKQKVSVILSFISMLTTIYSLKLMIILIGFWGMLNIPLFAFSYRQRSLFFSMKLVGWYFVSCLTYFVGILHGICIYFFKEKLVSEYLHE